VAQAKALPRADLVVLVDLLEPDLAVLLEPDLAVLVELRAVVPADRLRQAALAEVPVARVVPEEPLVVLADRAAVAARTPSSIPRTAKFPTQRKLARSLTT
jgi:hypothetical protein